MNIRHNPKLIVFPIIILLLFYLIAGLYNHLQITYYAYTNNKIPKEFNDYRIVQISDYHCKVFGKHNKKLIDAIIKLKPDVIVLTGDMIDGNHQDISPVNSLLQGITNIAPVYSVSGNHEFDTLAKYSELLKMYATYGVINLDDSQAVITQNNSSIVFYGLSADRMDILYNRDALPTVNPSLFSVALYHYSNHFDYFLNYGFDLILSGHTHGGIIRLPFIGGLIGNDGNFFPKYDGGEFTLGSTTMISSRGLGDSVLPRFYNPPELVAITLKCSLPME
jgi:uncharacterized protein